MYQRWWQILAVLLALLGPTVATAQALQSHDSIRSAARRFMLARVSAAGERDVSIKVDALDARLRLPACAAPLQAFAPPGGRNIGNTTVGVRCAGARPWTLYVPARVIVRDQVLVAQYALARGQTVTANALAWQERDLSRLSFGYLTDRAAALGKVLRRAVGAGTVITPDMLAAPLLVQRGQTVTLVAGGSAVAVRMSGKALSDGALGEIVRVRNPRSERVVQGVVVASGEVRVGS